jgi:hypothetical protein
MKKLSFLLVVAVLLAALLPVAISADDGLSPVPVDAEWYKLIAGQTMWVGNMAVWYDGANIHVRYQSLGDYCLNEIHTHVAELLDDIPQKNGNPTPGRFYYIDDELGCAHRAEAVIPFEWDGTTQLYVAAHAVVGRTDDPYWEETGWGVICGKIDEYGFPGSKWAAYILFPKSLPE